MKAQAAVEYMLIFAIGLTIAGLLWIFVTGESERSRYEVQLTYSKNALNKIANTADLVSIQGPPSQTYIKPVFPENIDSIQITNNTIIFTISYKGFQNNLSIKSAANITGNLSPVQGTHTILVKALNNYVEITDA